MICRASTTFAAVIVTAPFATATVPSRTSRCVTESSSGGATGLLAGSPFTTITRQVCAAKSSRTTTPSTRGRPEVFGSTVRVSVDVMRYGSPPTRAAPGLTLITRPEESP